MPAGPETDDWRSPLPLGTLAVPSWREVRVVAVTGSTNADVLALAAAGEPAGLVLVAEEQTAGRGRLDRTWTAPAGSGLTLSVLVRPVREPADASWLPLLAGLAAAEAVRSTTGLDVALKWPNDLVIGSRKLGGVLAERGADAVAVGLGLNVSLTAGELPDPAATSVLLEGSARLDRVELLEAVLARFAARYAAWDGPPGPGRADSDRILRSDYRAACTTLGRQVRAILPNRTLEGLATDVDGRGCLVVVTAAGPERVAAGDVVHVR